LSPEDDREAAGAVPPLRSSILAILSDPEASRESIDAFLTAETEAKALYSWFGEEVLRACVDTDHLRRLLDRDLAELDHVLNGACNALLHHPRLLELEANWRGIYWLTGSLTADGLTSIKLLDCRWVELARDLERASDFDQSTLFELVYNQEFGMPGGQPYSLLIGLYEVQHKTTRARPTDDIGVLRRLTAVAAAAVCPVMLGVRPAMFDVESFGELERRSSLAGLLRSADYNRFRSFRDLPDARFIGLVMPRMLLRAPYRGRANGDCGFRFEEIVNDGVSDMVWGVGALALGQICLRAFNDFRWLAAIRGTINDELSGGVVVDLPAPDFETDPADTVVRFPLQVNLTETLDRELTDAGFISIRRCKDTPFVSIANLPSAYKPRGAYQAEIARANEQLGSMINYMLCVSRFAHYIKIIARDFIGSFQSAGECQARLTRWINGYCTTGNDLSYELRARYPLESARISVQDVIGQPGSYECTMHLKPHLQLDQAVSEFQLVTVVQGLERQL